MLYYLLSVYKIYMIKLNNGNIKEDVKASERYIVKIKNDSFFVSN